MESFSKQTSANICMHGWLHIVAYLLLNNSFDSVGLPFCAQLTCVCVCHYMPWIRTLFPGVLQAAQLCKTTLTKSYLNFCIGWPMEQRGQTKRGISLIAMTLYSGQPRLWPCQSWRLRCTEGWRLTQAAYKISATSEASRHLVNRNSLVWSCSESSGHSSERWYTE